MAPPKKPGRWRLRLSLAALALAVVLNPVYAPAADKYWADATNWWDYGPWSPAGQPQDGDSVFLTQTDGTNRTVWYWNTAYPSAVLNSLRIDATGSGTMTLDQGYLGYAYPLASINEYVGYSGKGTHLQSAGTNAISESLKLGYNSGSHGTYELSGTGNLSANYQYIGEYGTGLFKQSGGANTVTNDLYLGIKSGSSGTYELSGTGSSLSAQIQYIGESGTGLFKQTGGTNTVTNDLHLGYLSGSNGEYQLSGSGSLSAMYQNIGYYGTGLFKQTGGVNTVTYELYLGNASGGSGTYELSGTGSLSANNQHIGSVGGTGRFYQTGGTNTVTNNLFLEGPGLPGSGLYKLSGSGQLTALNQFIGNQSYGLFQQTGGTNTVTNVLYLGNASGSSGEYQLSGTGSLSAQFQYIGNDGTGLFKQTGGTNTVSGGLSLGRLLNSSGTYELSGTGSLSANYQNIGANGTGLFKQTGGANTISGTLYLGRSSNGSGTYELSGSSSLSAQYQYIGNDGSGLFTQSGGANTVTGEMAIARNAGSSGAYNLQGGSLSAPTIQVNAGGAFNMSGGTLSGTLENRGAFTYDGGIFEGRLLAYAAPTFNADFTAGDGMANYTSQTIASGRTITLNGQGLDNSDTLTLAGGTLRGSGPLVNNAYLQGYGTIGGWGGFTNYGFVTQGGGTLYLNNLGPNVNYGNLDLAGGKLLSLGTDAYLYNFGTMNLNSAVITGAGALNNRFGGIISGKGTISSNFANDGGVLVVANGTTNITKGFTNNGLVQLTETTANLAGGAIANSGVIEGRGQVGNAVTNIGTIEALGGTLTLGGAVANNAGGLMTAGAGSKLLITSGLNTNAGVINLTGGTFDNNNHALSNTNQISGYGTFRTGGLSNTGTMTLTGGTTTVQGNVTNEATGHLNIAHNPAIFTGNVTNFGLVKTTGTTVTWAGTFTNSGGYISDPSTQNFTDLVVAHDGYLGGGTGDLFIISNDFINQSGMKFAWNTLAADLIFSSGTDSQHNLSLAGADLGAGRSGFQNNFAWGKLDLTGQSLALFDGNDQAGGALYVGEILGVSLSDMIVMNIFGNGLLNIYYDPDLNAYLHGLTYDLTGGGHLRPMGNPVPVPSSLLLLASGLIGLGGWRKFRKN